MPANIHATNLTVRRTYVLVLFFFMAASEIVCSFIYRVQSDDILRMNVMDTG